MNSAIWMKPKEALILGLDGGFCVKDFPLNQQGVQI